MPGVVPLPRTKAASPQAKQHDTSIMFEPRKNPRLSNHRTQQLPKEPPTNADDTNPIASQPPNNLTTKTEPRIRSPNASQSLNLATAHNATDQFDNINRLQSSAAKKQTTEIEAQFILCANRTLMVNSHHHLCRHDTTSLPRHPTQISAEPLPPIKPSEMYDNGNLTQPNPMVGSSHVPPFQHDCLP